MIVLYLLIIGICAVGIWACIDEIKLQKVERKVPILGANLIRRKLQNAIQTR